MKNSFPENFLWGASTSAHQVEGYNTNNDWYEWESTGQIEASGVACDHYNRFEDDFNLAKELNHNAHRMGIEWSRVEPSEGEWNNDEWEHYKKVISSLNSLGIEPVVTLNHFTVPIWLKNKNSWLNESSPELFARLAEKAILELGDKVTYWITINEPHMLAFISYFYGKWTPFIKDKTKSLTVIKNMLKGHALAYKRMHEVAKQNNHIKIPKIGVAKAVCTLHPDSFFSIKDRISAHKRNLYHNHAFINSLIKGIILFPGCKKEKLIAGKTLDFIGLNYYYRQFISSKESYLISPLGGMTETEKHKNHGIITDMGWEIYPKGIYEVSKTFKKYNLPIMITENGLSIKDDLIRRNYIKTHLEYVLKAINKNIPIIGYLHWSLLDNFEWSDGYTKRFGLIEVDYNSQKRTIRDSAKYYAEIIKNGKILQ